MERCKHLLDPATCGFCTGLVTGENQTRSYAPDAHRPGPRVKPGPNAKRIDRAAKRAGWTRRTHKPQPQEEPIMSIEKQCRVENCTRKVQARGLCLSDYDRWRRGDPEMIKLMGGPFKVVRPIKRSAKKPTGEDHDVRVVPTNSQRPVSEKGELTKVQKVIRILVAADIVTDEQVQAAYQMAGA